MIFQWQSRTETVTTIRVAEPLNDVCFFLHNLTIARSFGSSQAPENGSLQIEGSCVKSPMVCVCVCVLMLY